MNELVLKNCKLVSSYDEHYIKIANGKIAEISKQPLNGDSLIDIKGKLVFPGLIDPHVHFRDPGMTYKESFKTGSLAAANGGFTTIIDMPNTVPQTNTKKDFKEKIKIGESKSIIDFSLHSGLNTLEEMKKIAIFKPASFKVFMDLNEDDTLDEMFKNISNTNNTNKRKYQSKENQPNNKRKKTKKNEKNPSKESESEWKAMITCHCENKAIVDENTELLKKKRCIAGNQAIDYSYARPSEAEEYSIKQAIELAKKYNVKVHICHLSSKKSLAICKSEKTAIELSFEATPHHLLLNNSALRLCGTIAKTNPPLRPYYENLNISDVEAVDMIGTDHAPHSLDEKEKGVWNSSPGIPNLETTLPLLLTEVNKGAIDLALIPKILSENPAKVFNLPNKGSLEVGKDADLTVVDLKKEGKFNLDEFYTKAKYTPFKDQHYKGIATMTIANGNIIMENGNVNSENRGKYIYCD